MGLPIEYHILSTGGIAAKCHSAVKEKLIVAILNKLGEAKRTILDEKLTVGVKGHFIFIFWFDLEKKKVCKTINAKLIAN